MGWFKKIIMTLMIMLDNIVYSFVESLYELFIKISEAGLFSEATIQTFSNRIYVLLGLFMIFRISISLVQYITDPAKFSDKSVGGAKLLINGAVCLFAIVAVPYCFEAAYKLQGIILKDNIVGNLILGIKSTDSKESISYAERGGKLMAFSTFQAFMQFNDELVSRSCISNPVVDGKFNTTACTQEVYNIAYDANVAVIGENESVGDAKAITNVGGLYELAYQEQDFRLLANPDLAVLEVTSDGNTYTLMDYKWFISTLAGGFLCFVLLSFCFDVAVRSVKLGFLQLIAPVPIMFYLDPGNGKKKFDAWLKQVASTYLDLFIRLASIYFAVFIISSIATDGIINVAGSSNEVASPMVKVFIIFGALMFAKELPKLLSELLGTGKGGSFSLNPLKKVPGLSAAAGLGVGAVTGFGAASLSKFTRGREMYHKNLGEGNSRMQAFGNAIIGKEKGGSFLNNAFGVNDYRGQGLVGGIKGVGRGVHSIWGASGGALLGVGRESVAGGIGAGVGAYKTTNIKGINGAISKSVSGVSANRNRRIDYGEGYLTRQMDKFQRMSGVKSGYGAFGESKSKLNELQNKSRDIQARETSMGRNLANAESEILKNLSKVPNVNKESMKKLFEYDYNEKGIATKYSAAAISARQDIDKTIDAELAKAAQERTQKLHGVTDVNVINKIENDYNVKVNELNTTKSTLSQAYTTSDNLVSVLGDLNEQGIKVNTEVKNYQNMVNGPDSKK